jgi:hypothetical protein
MDHYVDQLQLQKIDLGGYFGEGKRQSDVAIPPSTLFHELLPTGSRGRPETAHAATG